MNRSNNETVCSIGLLIHLSNQFKDHLLNEYFAGTDITAPQFKVLISIYNGVISPVEVSKNVMVDGGALSRMVERMVKRELIVRQPHPDDKRQVILALTEKGREICRNFEQEGLRGVPAQLTARLTPQETEQLIYLLTKMLPDEVVARYLPY
ncbi:MarR family transcriptional regulator [Dickeya chrysanthemi]|uniref:MarR family transcriptional regulator n=1 Tax=Dickeya chrysanthemi TaxID=556 RepID=UPI000483D220|nr:MarR family transcriptional regulator [Dickeya chrysanthemi]